MIKRYFALIFGVLMLCSALVGCQESMPSTDLSFSDTNMSDLKKLDGQVVTITGYMSTLSPIDGSFMYLLNMPYQSCPFCIPNTTTLSNTVAIYAPSGKKFEFTDLLIKVTGTLEYSNTPFVDEYKYSYNFRIVDATYETVKTTEMTQEQQLWYSLATTGVISDVYSMYEYINFLCFWGTYTYPWESGEDYIYYADLEDFLYNEGTQFHYGLKDGYFENMIATIEDVDAVAFADLVENIRQAEAFSQELLTAIIQGDCEYIDEYSRDSKGDLIFGDGRKQFRMKEYASYDTRMNDLYSFFSDWVAGWEV